MERILGVAGAAFAFLAVALGAFGAHALRGRLEPRDLEIFEIGVRYQMFHALALLFLALWIGRTPDAPAPPFAAWAGWAFILGILVFSGSLYALVITGTRALGAITPLGGIAFLLGWVFIVLQAVRLP